MGKETSIFQVCANTHFVVLNWLFPTCFFVHSIESFQALLRGEDHYNAVAVIVCAAILYVCNAPNSLSVDLQGYKQLNAYIIVQNPVKSTVRNFWKVVVDRKCTAIVMLSNLEENGKVRSQLVGYIS